MINSTAGWVLIAFGILFTAAVVYRVKKKPVKKKKTSRPRGGGSSAE